MPPPIWEDLPRLFYDVVQAAPAAVIALDVNKKVRLWNPVAEEVFGWRREEVMGKPLPIVPPMQTEDASRVFDRQMEGETFLRLIRQRQRKDGKLVDIALSSAPLRNIEGRIYGVIGFLVDITEQKNCEKKLEETYQLLQATLSGIADAVFVVDPKDRTILAANSAVERIFGYTVSETLGKNTVFLHSDQGSYLEWDSLSSIGLNRGGIFRSEWRMKRKGGEKFWAEITVQGISKNVDWRRGVVSVIRDVTERKEYEEELARKSNYDDLTGLANRNLFMDRLNQAIAQADRESRPLVLLLLDLDRFQLINDSFGHSLGNEILKIVAERLKHCFRTHDTLARLSGDEFVTLLYGVDAKELMLIVEKVQSAVRVPFEVTDPTLHLSASIGIAYYPEDAHNGEDLIRRAEIAMYHVKGAGRNGFHFFQPGMDAKIMEIVHLEADLRKALARQEFLLHFQPKVDVATNKIIGSEALLRWRHPDNGMVSPGKFIPLAEQIGLIEELGEWVIRKACEQVKSLQDEGLPPSIVSVNVSAIQFSNDEFPETVRRILDDTGLDAKWLALELTESMLMERPERAIQLMDRLKKIGVGLYLDDFGTGYSSLNYLRRFPMDRLKIDRSFITDVATDHGSASVANSIVAIAHNLKMEVVAEGVETKEQLDFLKTCRCEAYQGFLFSRPLPTKDFVDLLRSKK